MIDNPPPGPQGDSQFHAWAKWVQGSILRLSSQEQAGANTGRTSRGTYVLRPQRRRKHLVEGQVIAKHYYVGHPPFCSHEIHSDEDTDALPGENPWIDAIAAFEEGGDPLNANRPAVDYEAYINPDSKRYLTWRATANGYSHTLTCAKHKGGGLAPIPFENGGAGIIYQHLEAYSPTAGWINFTFGLNDDGTYLNSNHSPYSGDAFRTGGDRHASGSGRKHIQPGRLADACYANRRGHSDLGALPHAHGCDKP